MAFDFKKPDQVVSVRADCIHSGGSSTEMSDPSGWTSHSKRMDGGMTSDNQMTAMSG
jgi:hypothetical protein